MARKSTTTSLKKRKRTQTAEAGSRGAHPVQEISSLVGSTRTPRNTRTKVCSVSVNVPENRQPFHEFNPSLESTRTRKTRTKVCPVSVNLPENRQPFYESKPSLESTRTRRKTRSIKGSASVNQPKDTQLIQEMNLSPRPTRTIKTRSTKASASADQLEDTQPIQEANASARPTRTIKTRSTKASASADQLEDTRPIQEANASARPTRTTKKNQTTKDSTKATGKTRLKETQPIQEANASLRSATMGKRKASATPLASARQSKEVLMSEIIPADVDDEKHNTRSHKIMPADVDDEIYNIPSHERTELLTQIKAALGGQPVSLAFWALCYVAPIDGVEVFDVDKDSGAEVISGQGGSCGGLRHLASMPGHLLDPCVFSVATLPLQWNQKFRDPGEIASRLPESAKRRKLNNEAVSSVSRSTKAVDNCKLRDNGICVLTKNGNPQAAHIFPHCMLSPPPTFTDRVSTRFDIWKALRIFWDKDQIQKWRNRIFTDLAKPDVGVEGCFNLISLSPDVHDMWNQGLFALMPLALSEDRKKLTVQFFWQVPGNYEIGTKIDLLTKPTSSKGLKGTTKNSKPLHLCDMGRADDNGPCFIRSGDEFTLTTEDPKNLPLPSWELLEMQWALQRVVGMCGAADWPNLDDYDDDDDVADNEYARQVSIQRVRDWPFDGKAADSPEFSTPIPEFSTPSPAPWVGCH